MALGAYNQQWAGIRWYKEGMNSKIGEEETGQVSRVLRIILIKLALKEEHGCGEKKRKNHHQLLRYKIMSRPNWGVTRNFKVATGGGG